MVGDMEGSRVGSWSRRAMGNFLVGVVGHIQRMGCGSTASTGHIFAQGSQAISLQEKGGKSEAKTILSLYKRSSKKYLSNHTDER